MIDWDRVQSPLVTHADYSLKDPALIHADGWFQLVCSVFDRHNHSRVMAWRSRNLADWEGPLWEWGSGADGWCSPDIVRDGDQWIMSLQSWDGVPPRDSTNQLAFSCSSDGQNWSAPAPLAAELTQGVRAIDAALALHDHAWYLIYKEAQTPRLARGPCLEGPWELLPNPLGVWAENGQFLKIDGRWHLMATILHHRQGLSVMNGDPDEPQGWSEWQEFRELETPIIPGFNDFTPANASSLWDGRQLDGHWYRVFCAAAQPTDGNFGWQLGVARSRDLITWTMPPVR